MVGGEACGEGSGMGLGPDGGGGEGGVGGRIDGGSGGVGFMMEETVRGQIFGGVFEEDLVGGR